MLLQGVCLVAFVAVQFVNGAPFQDEKIVPVPLNTLCAQTLDKSNKSAILLVHGLSGSYHDWDGVWEELVIRTRRKVCAIDIRNHGESPWNNRSDVESMAADITPLLDDHDIKKVNIIGHSLGGKIAVHYTLRNPERVNSLIVEDMRPNGLALRAFAYVKYAATLLHESMKNIPEGSNEDEARNFIREFINNKLKEFNFNERFDEKQAKDLPIVCEEKCRLKWNLELLLKYINSPLEQFLTPSSGLYEGPALFIYGTSSVFDVAGDESNIIKLFPKARLVGVQGAGHQIHRNFPQFTNEVVSFLNNLED